MDDYEWIESLVCSYFYNRERTSLIAMIQGVINRILDKPYGELNAGDDDTDILMGAIVIQYGECGTSPRFGWIYDKYKDGVLEKLKELLEYHQEQLEY